MPIADMYDTGVLYFTEKLQARLNSIPDYALTVLEAPMGYGKTTAVRFVLQNTNASILWHTVYADGVAYFWNSFCKALAPLGPELADSLQKLGLPTDAVLVQKAVELIGGVRLTQATVLVIDDYHFVASDSLDNFFCFLLANLPPKLHIVITSRTVFLPKVIAGLQLKGDVNYIGTECFLLQSGDIAKYYALCGIVITKEQQASLFAYSEGWITPLYLSMRQYVEHGRFFISDNVAALVHSMVYQPLDTGLKKFLHCICLFDSFTMDQAQYMYPEENAAGPVEELFRKNAFIARDATTGRYCFHNLFLSHVRSTFARQSQECRNALWERAGHWHLKQQECAQAMTCFENAGNFRLILMALSTVKGAAVTGEHRQKIIRYFDDCPQELKIQNLAAMLVFIRFMISYNESVRLKAACAIFEGQIDAFGGTREQKNALWMEYERLLSLTKYNNIREMSKHHRNALYYMDKPVTGEENKGNWTFGSPSVLLMFYRESGRLAAQVNDLKECLPYYCRLADGHGSGAEFVMEAEAALYVGAIEKAEAVIHKGQHYARGQGQWSIMLAAAFVQMRLALLHGSYPEAVSLQRQTRDLIETNKQYLLLHTLDMCESYMYLLLNLPGRTAGWIAGGNYTGTRLMFPALPALYIVQGRYLLANGEYRKLQGMAEVFLTAVAVYPNLLSEIYTRIYLAAAHHKLTAKDEAIASLKAALAIALPDRVYLPFAENGSYIMDLLKQLAAEEQYAGHVKQIFSLRKKHEQGIKKILRTHFAAHKPDLTARENEVAVLAAAGLSNREIASNLVISENTVKARLKMVFEKLAIKSRVQLQERLKDSKAKK